jgi:hypothetical protein
MQASQLLGATIIQLLLNTEHEAYEPTAAAEAAEWTSACAAISANNALQYPSLHAYAYGEDSQDGLSKRYLHSLPRQCKRLPVFAGICP